MDSGAEATENAIKVARHHTKRQNVIVFNGGFHGRTFGKSSKTKGPMSSQRAIVREITGLIEDNSG